MPEILGAALAFFLWGLSRGLSTCLFLCAPGMIPMIVDQKAGLARSLWLGFLLSLPRILILTALGAVLGFISFEVLGAANVRGSMTGISIAAYIFLGLMLVFIGARLLGTYGTDAGEGKRVQGAGCRVQGNDGRRAAGRMQQAAGTTKKGSRPVRHPAPGTLHPTPYTLHPTPSSCEPKTTWWTRLWIGIAKRFYPGKGKGATVFLLWGGVLSMACLAEVGLLEGTAVSVLAGSGESAVLASAGFGALMMLALSLGATVPIMAAAAVGGEIVERVKDQKRLETIRGVSAMLMVLLGLFFVLREVYIAITLLGLY